MVPISPNGFRAVYTRAGMVSSKVYLVWTEPDAAKDIHYCSHGEITELLGDNHTLECVSPTARQYIGIPNVAHDGTTAPSVTAQYRLLDNK